MKLLSQKSQFNASAKYATSNIDVFPSGLTQLLVLSSHKKLMYVGNRVPVKVKHQIV